MPRSFPHLASIEFVLTVLLCVAASAASARADDPNHLVAQTPPRTPAEQAAMFHLPAGFRIELVAAEPDVIKPMNMSFDAAGRMYVTQSVEYPYAAPADRPGRDTIRLIVDTDGNGVPDRVTTFADGLNIPIGVTPLYGAVLGYSIPDLYLFPDADGDGKADSRSVAYREFGFGDTHGMSSSLHWWVDGWVYGCHGYANTSTIQGADNQAVTMNSGNTYRLKPDGSHIEYYTHGQVNPFGMSIDPLGNIYTSDCHSRPIYTLVHGAYYPSFGKPHDGLGFGPEMMQHSHGSTGIAGVVYYSADQFPESYRGTAFVLNPVTGRVNHDKLELHGSTYKAVEQPDFISCDDRWFRPVDMQIGPDGSLYIADFYNSIIGHYEVPLDHPLRDRTRGRIWRVTYVGDGKGKFGTPAVDLAKADVNQLIAALGHPNLMLRTHATHQLVHRIGAPAVEAVLAMLDRPTTAEQRAHAIWVLYRLNQLGPQVVQRFAHDEDRLVRVHLMKALAEREEWIQLERAFVFVSLLDRDPFVRRAAAEAVGRHPDVENLPALLQLWRTTPAEDSLLVHTARIAMRDTLAKLYQLETSPEEQFADNDEALGHFAEVALGISSPHAASLILDFYQRQSLPAERVVDVFAHVGRHADASQRSQIDALAAKFRDGAPQVQLDVLQTLFRALRERDQKLSDEQVRWAGELAVPLISGNDEGTTRRGIEFAHELQLVSAVPSLVRIAGNASANPDLRARAVDALVTLDANEAMGVIATVLIDVNSPERLRQQMADSLGRMNSPTSRSTLVALFKVAPESLALAVARSLASSREGANDLVVAVEKGAASPRLLQDRVVDERIHNANVADLEARLSKLLEGLPPGDERVRELIATHKAAFTGAQTDLTLGSKLFEKNCSICHQLDGKGKKIGPELDGIGLRGLDRLLEDLLDPNRNVDANFRATTILLKSGLVVNGLVQREEGKVLIVINDKGQEQRISLDDVEERKPSKLSPMPANVSELMKVDEFPHLMAFLLDQRRKREQAAK